jgi:hypothetical protein
MAKGKSNEEISSELLDALRAAFAGKQVIATLSRGHPNEIVSIEPRGILVSTGRSETSGAGPQLVSAWMLNEAWRLLQLQHQLTNAELLDRDIRRSSAVCAILAALPQVEVVSTRPIKLRLTGGETE